MPHYETKKLFKMFLSQYETKLLYMLNHGIWFEP